MEALGLDEFFAQHWTGTIVDGAWIRVLVAVFSDSTGCALQGSEWWGTTLGYRHCDGRSVDIAKAD